MHISPKELVPIVIAVALWAPYWSGQRICCYCDNSADVFTVNKGTTRDPQLMRLMRALYFFCASYNVTVSARHIPGVLSTSADALSRGNLPTFLALNPQASLSRQWSQQTCWNWYSTGDYGGPRPAGPSCSILL